MERRKYYTRDAAKYLDVDYRTFTDKLAGGSGPTPSGKTRKKDSPQQWGRFWYAEDLDAWKAGRPNMPRVSDSVSTVPESQPAVKLSELLAKALGAGASDDVSATD